MALQAGNTGRKTALQHKSYLGSKRLLRSCPPLNHVGKCHICMCKYLQEWHISPVPGHTGVCVLPLASCALKLVAKTSLLLAFKHLIELLACGCSGCMGEGEVTATGPMRELFCLQGLYHP